MRAVLCTQPTAISLISEKLQYILEQKPLPADHAAEALISLLLALPENNPEAFQLVRDRLKHYIKGKRACMNFIQQLAAHTNRRAFYTTPARGEILNSLVLENYKSWEDFTNEFPKDPSFHFLDVPTIRELINR